jgi:hypothetical protein
VLGACLINPSGLSGVLLPFSLLVQKPALDVLENQSIFFMVKNFSHNPVYIYFLVSLVFLFIPWVILIKREGFKKHVFMIGIMLFLSLWAMKAIRLMGLYGFFWIPLTSYAWGKWMQSWPVILKERITVLLLIAGGLASLIGMYNWHRISTLGLTPGINNSAQFFKENKIAGPIFNNYDIGGYLIFHLSPEYKLFIDNRPEAFPTDFIIKAFISMQMDEAVWKKVEEKCRFNVIFFNRNDLTPWGHGFILKRLQDPSWAIVFADQTTIIFLKRNTQNAYLISRYEWPLRDVKILEGQSADHFDLNKKLITR